VPRLDSMHKTRPVMFWAVVMEVSAPTDLAIKRPKDICAGAIFVHTFVSVRGDFGIWLARPTCVQTLHTERSVPAEQSRLLAGGASERLSDQTET